MAIAFRLIQMILHLSELSTSPWETCATTLIQKNNPSSVYLYCKSSSMCPSEHFYRRINVPTQTIHDTKIENLPAFQKSDLVFLLSHSEEPCTWSNKTIQRYRIDGHNNFKFVIVSNMSETSSRDLEYLETLFRAMWESGLVYSAVLLKNETSATLFTYIPFRNSETCEDTRPVNLGGCVTDVSDVFDPMYKSCHLSLGPFSTPGKSTVIGTSSVCLQTRNLNNCTLSVAVMDDVPFIAYPLEGVYKPLLLEMGHRMNFSIKPFQSEDKRAMATCGGPELEGIGGDVIAGRAHFGVGPFTIMECNKLKRVGIPYMQCLSWCTPILPGSADVLDFLTGQLQTSVWIALALTIFVLSLSVALLSFFSREALATGDVVNLILSVFAQVPRLPFQSTRVRAIVALWFWTCVVLRTAYEGGSKTRSTVPIGSYIIRDLEELAHMKLQLTSTTTNVLLLADSGEPLLQRLHNHTKALDGGCLYDALVKAGRERNGAVYTVDIRCNILSTRIGRGMTSTLYPYTGGCMKTLQVTPLVTLPGSPFNEEFEDILQRFGDAGLIQKWLNVHDGRINPGVARSYSLRHLLPALIFLSIGWLIGCVVFLIEVALKQVTSSRLNEVKWMTFLCEFKRKNPRTVLADRSLVHETNNRSMPTVCETV